MIFTSVEFLVFAAIVFALYWWGCRGRGILQNLLLVAASYVFYGWVDWRLCGLLLLSTGCAYGTGLWMANAQKRKRGAVIISLALNLGILCFYKYFNFFSQSFCEAARLVGFSLDLPTLNLVLPIGISFYSFMSISYTLDVYWGKVRPTSDVVAFFACMDFFPQLLAGPISRVGTAIEQFKVPRKFEYALATDGCRQILWGLFKKIVIADGCAKLTGYIWADCQTLPGSTLLVGAFIYTMQIYADFSGYSDIAIGCGKLFGIRLMRNFAFPYFATNIADFWRRWHISLTTWFRDYVYIPLGGSRCGRIRHIRNVFVVFLLCGLWHGAHWTFVIWGFVHACFFIPLFFLPKGEGKIRQLVAWAMTFFVVMLAWIFFRAPSISMAVSYFDNLFSRSLFVLPRSYLSMMPWLAVMLAVEWLQRGKEHGLALERYPMILRWLFYLAFSIFCITYFQRSSEFIYFQF